MALHRLAADHRPCIRDTLCAQCSWDTISTLPPRAFFPEGPLSPWIMSSLFLVKSSSALIGLSRHPPLVYRR